MACYYYYYSLTRDSNERPAHSYFFGGPQFISFRSAKVVYLLTNETTAVRHPQSSSAQVGSRHTPVG
jgi:hypothetical protein